MQHPHYVSPKAEQQADRAAKQSDAQAFLARRTVQPRSHGRILQPIN